MAKASRKVLTGPFTISFPNVFKPRKNDAGQDKYSASLVFSDMAEVKRLQGIALEVAKEAFGEGAAEKIRKKQLKFPFRDGEEKDYAEGTVFFNAASNQQPGVVDRYNDPATGKARVITDANEIYPGAVCRADLTCYSYDRPDSKGVTFGLNNIQLLDGTTARLDNRQAAADVFDADDQALADLADVTGETEQEEEPEAEPEPVKAKPKAKAAVAKKSTTKKTTSVLDELE